METRHDTNAPARDDAPIFIEPADDAPLTADERDTLRTAFATLVRSGRPLFAPPTPGEERGPLDPADPSLDARVRAIIDRPLGVSDNDTGEPSA